MKGGKKKKLKTRKNKERRKIKHQTAVLSTSTSNALFSLG